MTLEEERWAEALQVVKMKGAEALAFVAERITELEAVGAMDGVARWREIEVRVRAVGDAERQRQ